MALDEFMADFSSFLAGVAAGEGSVRAGVLDAGDNAKKLAYNELGIGSEQAADGTPQLRGSVVARMPLTAAFDTRIDAIQDQLVDAAAGPRGMGQALDKVGTVLVAATRANIDAGLAPLAEATLARRRARGESGTTPLKDTGQLYDGLSHEVSRG